VGWTGVHPVQTCLFFQLLVQVTQPRDFRGDVGVLDGVVQHAALGRPPLLLFVAPQLHACFAVRWGAAAAREGGREGGGVQMEGSGHVQNTNIIV